MPTLLARTIRLAHTHSALRPQLLPLLRMARMAPPGLRDVFPDSKDKMRIQDMAAKSKDPAHMLRLAAQMAKAITDAGKAFRRGAAAEAAGYLDVAKVFYDRCDALTGFRSDDGAERARKEEEARKERARKEEEEARRRRDTAAPSPAGGGFNEAAIRRKIESVKRLRDGATTPGERAAAENALKVLELKLRTMRLATSNPRLAAYLMPILRETWEE